MAPTNMIQDDMQDDDIFADDALGNDEDERVKAEILAKFDDGDNEPDDGGMDQPLEDEQPLDITPQSDGQKAIERSEEDRRKERKTADVAGEEDNREAETKAGDDKEDKEDKAKGPDEAADTDAAEKGKGKEDNESGDGKAESDLTNSDFDALLDGVPDDRKAEINRRMKEVDAAMEPFKTPYVQEQIKRHGVEPKQVASRLVELATFAEQKPDEYLAWAAQEMAASPDKVGEVLASAAKLHGYKLVKEGEAENAEEDDEDLFLDDKTRKILEENKRLKAAQEQPRSFGPDTPERQQQRSVEQTLTAFIGEKDETGNLKRPLWDHLQPQITQMAANHKQQTGKMVTVEDLGQFYDSAVEQARKAFGAPSETAEQAPSAAQGNSGMSEDLKKRAAAAERAKRASKSIGGAGQGASRQPAKSSESDQEQTLDVVRKLAQEMGFDS